MYYRIVDGNWSEWSEWTPCTVTCGGGTSLRTRQCIYPVEFMHGSSCNGSSAVAKTCEMQQCAHAEGFEALNNIHTIKDNHSQ